MTVPQPGHKNNSAMKLRFLPVGIVAVLALAVGGYMFLLERGVIEKKYEGKPASYWIEALQDKDPKVSRKAMEALYEIAPRSKEAARLLLDFIKADPDPNVLRNIRTGEASPNMATISLGAILKALGSDAIEFLPDLIALLGDQGCFHRVRACRLLGEMGPNARDAIPALKKAVSDEFSPVRDEAANALKLIGP
jgi:HEAT repeat protein